MINRISNFTSFAVLTAICVTAQPLLGDQIYGDFSYTKSVDGVTITDFTNSSAEKAVIPALIDGKPVTAIGKEAFYNRQTLTRITIPDTVTRIGESAFYGCNRLMDLSLPGKLTSVGDTAFLNCESLLSIALPPGVKFLGGGAFQGCRRLRTISLPSDITAIKRYTFIGCESLSEINIPEGVTHIASYAFGQCNELETVVLPKRLRSIPAYAFYECYKLKNLKLPAGLTEIGYGAFTSCRSLTRLIIPASVTTIGYSAFDGCKSLTKVTFLGNAPRGDFGWNPHSGPRFNVYHLEDGSGFTSPTWRGYPCEVTMLAPEIELREPVRTLLVDEATKRSFGSAAVGGARRVKTFTVTNTGIARMTGLVVTIDGRNATDFKITTPGRKSLSINGTTTFNVTFVATKAGPRQADIHISSNELAKNPFDIRLDGVGVAP